MLLVEKNLLLLILLMSPMYAFAVLLPTFMWWALWFPLIACNWVYALQVGSVLAGDTITEVTESMQRTSPRDPKWQTEVVVGVKKLVSTTLPDLSNTFGNVLGYVTLACWALAMACFGERTLRDEPLLSAPLLSPALLACACSPPFLSCVCSAAGYLRTGSIFYASVFVTCAFLPFGLASTVSDTSDKADILRDGINKKRLEDLSVRLELAALEACMDNENRGQGLGFVAFGVAIDKVRASPHNKAPLDRDDFNGSSI